MTTLTNTTLEEGELEQTICEPAATSWYEQCEQSDEKMTNRSVELDQAAESNTSSNSSDSFSVHENSVGSEHSSGSGDREILVSFLDASNEAKFERLLKEDKIKTTFKRCLSPTSASKSSDSKRVHGNECDLDETNDSGGSSCGRERDLSPQSTSDRSTSSAGKRAREYETDEGILDRRQKQIDYGKNTIGYDEYTKQVPREKRTEKHPWTPQKNLKYSRRAFDGLVKIWRKQLHCFDPSNAHASSATGVGDGDGETVGKSV